MKYSLKAAICCTLFIVLALSCCGCDALIPRRRTDAADLEEKVTMDEQDDSRIDNAEGNATTQDETTKDVAGTGAGHTHSYENATCTEPVACACGATIGTALGHNYTGRYCNRCGQQNPDYVPENSQSAHTHYYTDATCTEPQKCECGSTFGEALGHQYADGTCIRCGEEQ